MMSKINTIPLEEAQDWAKRWKKKEGNYNKHNELHAFLIPKIDLQEVLAEGVDAVRAYIGVEKKKDGTFEEKLMIVGTRLIDGVYVDMITNTGSAKADSGLDGDIYDFTAPCPTACDPGSPLNY